ncbi:hypothetical protein [Treponema endosymbiont of Eucomonympha sp.]|nr:hypothetical protein [Treponema endosymbiont of Eucomonympha sp.]
MAVIDGIMHTSSVRSAQNKKDDTMPTVVSVKSIPVNIKIGRPISREA